MTAGKLIITAMLLSATTALTTGCSSCSADGRQTRDSAKLGEEHATMLCDTILPEHELTRRLLAVRAHEWELRKSGNADAADAYIDAFRNRLKAGNDSLATRIF